MDADFDDNGTLDTADVDALVAEIAGNTNNADFDLNGDTIVNGLDLTEWLAIAGATNLPSGNSYLLADANLDGLVDGQDFIAWNTNKFTALAQWSGGDFNADGIVDGQDFILWNTNKFQSALDASVVPEPSGMALLLGTMLALGGWRRKSTRR